MTEPAYLPKADGQRLAYRWQPGMGPTVVLLPGFLSDMTGSKAEALARACAARGQACLRFDYSGHGASDGVAADGTIEIWRDDALVVIDQLTTGPLLLVGSSMGGWISLLAALARPDRVRGLVLVAPAPDFTDWGMTNTLSTDQLDELARTGRIEIPSEYGPEPYVYTLALLQSGARCRLLDKSIPLTIPVRILHGQKDPDVPWQLSLTLTDWLESADVQVTLIKDGDHRLSRPADIALLCRLVAEMP